MPCYNKPKSFRFDSNIWDEFVSLCEAENIKPVMALEELMQQAVTRNSVKDKLQEKKQKYKYYFPKYINGEKS